MDKWDEMSRAATRGPVRKRRFAWLQWLYREKWKGFLTRKLLWGFEEPLGSSGSKGRPGETEGWARTRVCREGVAPQTGDSKTSERGLHENSVGEEMPVSASFGPSY